MSVKEAPAAWTGLMIASAEFQPICVPCWSGNRLVTSPAAKSHLYDSVNQSILEEYNNTRSRGFGESYWYKTSGGHIASDSHDMRRGYDDRLKRRKDSAFLLSHGHLSLTQRLPSCWDFKLVTFKLDRYTLGKKGCYIPIEDNKTNVDRTFVFPLGWNWHDPWLFPKEIRHYLGQTFNTRSSGIVELRNHSIGGRSPKSIFTLWQLWINICILFQKCFWLFEQCPVQPLWVLGMRCLHLPVRALSKVLLLPVWVWLVLPSTAYSKGMLPLDLWCQASLQGLPERQHLGKTVHCWGWSDSIVSWVLGPWRRGWEICTEWGLVAQRLTTDSCPVVTRHIDPQRSPCWLPTTVVSAWSGRRGGGTWQWPTGGMSSSVMSRDSNFTR